MRTTNRTKNLKKKTGYQRLADSGCPLLELHQKGKKAKSPVEYNWEYAKGLTSSQIKTGYVYGLSPHRAGLTVLDIDYVPGYSKDDFSKMGVVQAQETINEFIKVLFNDFPHLKNKLLFRNWSGSRKGCHLWFVREKSNERLGRPGTGCGELFDGTGQVVVYDPFGLADAIDKKAWYINKATLEDCKDLAEYQKPILTEKGLEKALELSMLKFPDARGFVEALGDGKKMPRCATDAIAGIPGIEMNRPLSRKKEYTWTPAEIGAQFDNIPINWWFTYNFWAMAGMMLKDIGTNPVLFQIWTALSKLCIEKYNPSHQQKAWDTFKIKESVRKERKGVSMGRICEINKILSGKVEYVKKTEFKDYSHIKEWLEKRIVADESGVVTAKDMYDAFKLDYPGDEIKQNSLSMYFKSNFLDKLGGEIKRKIKVGYQEFNGYKGVKLL